MPPHDDQYQPPFGTGACPACHAELHFVLQAHACLEARYRFRCAQCAQEWCEHRLPGTPVARTWTATAVEVILPREEKPARPSRPSPSISRA